MTEQHPPGDPESDQPVTLPLGPSLPWWRQHDPEQPHGLSDSSDSSDLSDRLDPPAAPDAPVTATSPGGEQRRVPRVGRRNVLALGAALVIVALLAAGVVTLSLRLQSARQAEAARTQASAASRDAARVLFSYDFKTLDADFARGLTVTTGAFRDEYSRTTQRVVKDVALRYQAVVVADVVESAVVQAAPDAVTTIVFLNQATTSTRVEGQKIDLSRVRMHLVHRHGRWLVDKVDAL